MKQIFAGAVFVLALAQFIIAPAANDFVMVFAALCLFFIGFNVLEATLPSLIAKTSPPDIKGTAMGVYSTFQFTGAFVGGALGGWILGHFGAIAVFLFNGLCLLVWLVMAASMRNPRYLGSFLINVGPMPDEQARRLAMEITAVTGVAEAVVIGEEGIAYLKVDNHALDREALKKFAAPDAEKTFHS
jgi:MFS family permease